MQPSSVMASIHRFSSIVGGRLPGLATSGFGTGTEARAFPSSRLSTKRGGGSLKLANSSERSFFSRGFGLARRGLVRFTPRA